MAAGEGTCTWPYALVDGVRTHISDAARLQHGVCPVCGAELVARKGKFNQDHWWHVNGKKCDPWYQPKGPWHLYWQNKFPKEWQEVVIEKEIEGDRVRHIADVKTDGGVIVEAQYSHISVENIAIREAFYENMLWIASMCRVGSDKDLLQSIKFHESYSVGDEKAWVFDNLGRIKKQKWCYASKPVVFDFSGSFEKPESDEDLICLLPRVGEDEERICIGVTRNKLIDALSKGTVGALFQQWKGATVGLIERFKKDSEARRLEEQRRSLELRRKEASMMRERMVLERRRQEEAQKAREQAWKEEVAFYERIGLSAADIHEFMSDKFVSSYEVALSLGWVEIEMIMRGLISHYVGVQPSGLPVPKIGSLVLHYAISYTYEDFTRDRQHAMNQYGNDVAKELDFEGLRKLSGKVIGAAEYCLCGSGKDAGVVFRNVREMRRRFDLWSRKIGFSILTKKQSDLFLRWDYGYDYF